MGSRSRSGARTNGWTWIGTLPAEDLPTLPDAQAADAVLIAVRDFASARESRGG